MTKDAKNKRESDFKQVYKCTAPPKTYIEEDCYLSNITFAHLESKYYIKFLYSPNVTRKMNIGRL